MSLNNSPYFLDGISHACSQWGNALSLNISSSITYYDAPIRYFGGTLSAINTFWDYQLSNGLNGITDSHFYPTDTWYLGSMAYTGVTIDGAEGCIIDKGHTLNQTKKTCTHELGHALGWIGHSGTSSDIMYKHGSSTTSLTYRDIHHLSQVY
ncbi:MAG: matrixin family metalloprotease [Lachnospiraceae bacterium]|nr:matrixin family metalloprotease [Lachnospiraceae bacterium]